MFWSAYAKSCIAIKSSLYKKQTNKQKKPPQTQTKNPPQIVGE